MALTTSVAEKLPGYYEIGLTGRLDTETHAELEKVTKGLLAKARGLRLDLAKLSYISSMGLRVVLQLAKSLREKKTVFQITNMQPQIKKIFDIAATLPSENIFASVAEADAYFDAVSAQKLGELGFLRPANIGPGWRMACEPAAADFARVLELRFRHLVPAHGEIIRDTAHAQLAVTSARFTPMVVDASQPTSVVFEARITGTPSSVRIMLVSTGKEVLLSDDGTAPDKAAAGVVLEANEYYWRKVPAVKRLVFKGVPEETTRLAMLKRQEVDITFGLGGALAEEVRRDPRLKLEPVYPTLAMLVPARPADLNLVRRRRLYSRWTYSRVVDLHCIRGSVRPSVLIAPPAIRIRKNCYLSSTSTFSSSSSSTWTTSPDPPVHRLASSRSS